MGLQTHEDLPQTPDKLTVISPKSVGWEPIGDSHYAFTKLVEVHGHDAFTGYNRMPPYFEKVEESKLVTMTDYTSYPLIAYTYRQIVCDYDGTSLGYMLQGSLFLNSLGRGFMMVFDYKQKKVRFFTFCFCLHDYTTVESRLHYSRVKCTLCGHERSYDSSD
jgi:hypothetical protein